MATNGASGNEQNSSVPSNTSTSTSTPSLFSQITEGISSVGQWLGLLPSGSAKRKPDETKNGRKKRAPTENDSTPSAMQIDDTAQAAASSSASNPETLIQQLSTALQSNQLEEARQHALLLKAHNLRLPASLKRRLQSSIDNNQPEILQIITDAFQVKFDADADADADADVDATFLLLRLISLNKIEIAMILIRNGANVHQATFSGWTVLHCAARYGHTDCARLLIEKGAIVNQTDNNGNTPLHATAPDGHTDCARLLIEKGAVVNQVNSDNDTPLNLAVEKGHTDCARLLIEKGANDIPLILAVEKGHTDCVRLLIEKGANVNEANGLEGCSALHFAAFHGHTDCVRLLIEKGAVVNQTSTDGNISLHAAVQNGHIDCAGLLIEKGAVVNQASLSGWTPLHAAVQNGHTDCAGLLIEKGAVVNQPTTGNRDIPLHAAAINGHTNCVRLLIEKGAVVNQTNTDGNTALHATVQNGHTDCAGLLIEKGANVHQANSSEVTPLHMAASFGHVLTVKFLLSLEAVSSSAYVGQALATNENHLLCQAASEGDLVFVNQLLTYLEVVTNITANENAALRAADNNHRRDVVNRLLEFPAVRDLARTSRGRPTLRDLANNRENAMRALDNSQNALIKMVHEKYHAIHQSRGEATVLADLKTYLEAEYKKSPAKDAKGNNLPLEFKAGINQTTYYAHTIHTAWRYLFCAPNPWIAPDAQWVRVVPGGRAADISLKDKTLFALFWLAAVDEGYTPLPTFTKESIQQNFVKELSLIGRAHNWDRSRLNSKDKSEEYDDNEGDNPSCDIGVTQRLMQSLIGHPITEEAKTLSPQIWQKMLGECLITEHEDYPNNLYAKLRGKTPEELQTLKTDLEKLVSDLEKSEALNELSLDDKTLADFIAYAKAFFGKEPIEAKTSLQLMDIRAEGYEALTTALSLDLPRFYYEKIMQVIDTLITSKKEPGSAITHAFSSQQAAASEVSNGAAMDVDGAEERTSLRPF